MKLFRFDIGVGKNVDRYNSSGFVISKVAHWFDEAVVNCAYLKANGVIGFHQAVISELFLVTQGEGWVRGETLDSKVSITAGQAAYWEKGEWHESGTETGMTAIIIEGINFDLAEVMPQL